MSDLAWHAEYIELKERENEDFNRLSKMLGVLLEKEELEAYFGSESKSTKRGPLTSMFYPLAFALNPNYYEAAKKSFTDRRTCDIQKIYKAWKSGATIEEMQEQGLLDPGIKIKNTDDFVEIIEANLAGETRKTPWGEMQVINLYNEDFDKEYLNFVSEIQNAEMAKIEKKKFNEMKKFENVDPSLIIDPFAEIIPNNKEKSGITIKMGSK